LDSFIVSVPSDVSYYNNHFYSNKPPGFAFLVVPAYVFFYHFLLPLLGNVNLPDFLPFFPALLGSILSSFTFLLAELLGANRRVATFCSLVAALGTIQMVYALSFMNNIATALFLVLTLWAAFKYRISGKVGHLLLAAFFMGYAILVNISAAAMVVPAACYLAWFLFQRCREPGWVWQLIGALGSGGLPLTLLMLYNFFCFGDPFLTSYNYYQAPSFIQLGDPVQVLMRGNFGQGLWGLTFGLSRGIFIHTPVLLCAIPGIYWGLKRRQTFPELLVITMTVLVIIAVFAQYPYWFGGHLIGARHILPALPLLSILMYPFIVEIPLSAKAVVFIATLPSVVVHFMLTFLQHDVRALGVAWSQGEANHLGHLYTEILPLFNTTSVDLWGVGIFRVAKLVLMVLVVLTVFWLGWRMSLGSPENLAEKT
jgi:hypothetical protein